MCGIVGYIGKRDAYPILVKGLKRLEYRGYDSAGVALVTPQGQLNVYKATGKVSELERAAAGHDLAGQTGIAHTRWATHGEPSQANAHPHLSASGNLALVHNGIIENYAVIKQRLEQKGIPFRSSTDTEALVQLIDYLQAANHLDLLTALQLALREVIGAYAIALADRRDAPLHIVDLDNVDVDTRVQTVAMNLGQLEKGGYPHFMLKEIFEQPDCINDCMRGRIHPETGRVTLSAVRDHHDRLLAASRFIIVACGTSWHAGLIGKQLIESLCRMPVEVEYASEFRYRTPVILPTDVVIAISQSGETADTLAAVQLAKEQGAFIYGICNAVGSSLTRITDTGSYIHVGPEIGVASTKAFTGQVTVLTLLALALAQEKGMPATLTAPIAQALATLPGQMKEVLAQHEAIGQLSRIFTYAHNFLYLGRGYNYPVALEGALKLKEISYIHAEGYPAAEMKHGPIALIDTEMPVVVIATRNVLYDKVISNIQEIKSRRGKVIALVTEGDTGISTLADECIALPPVLECLEPLITTIPLQLLAYHIAVCKGKDVDQPRNLAKSVTVE